MVGTNTTFHRWKYSGIPYNINGLSNMEIYT